MAGPYRAAVVRYFISAPMNLVATAPTSHHQLDWNRFRRNQTQRKDIHRKYLRQQQNICLSRPHLQILLRLQRLVMEALSFHNLISFNRSLHQRFLNSLKMKSELKFEEVLPKLRHVIIQIKNTDDPPHSIIQD